MPAWRELEQSLPRVVKQHSTSGKGLVDYIPPPWADFDPKEVLDTNSHGFSVDIISNGTLLENVQLGSKAYYALGSMDECELVYKNPLVSRKHLILQLNRHGGLLLFDLNSTHGTTVNHKRVEPETYYLLKDGDQIRIGQRGTTSRTYVVCGPPETERGDDGTEETARPKKIAKKSPKTDEQEIMDAVKRATAADYYDTNLYFDEWGSYFDRDQEKAVKRNKPKQKTHTSESIKGDLRRLYQEEVDALNRWYKVLASAINDGLIEGSQKMSKTDSQLKKIQLKGFNEDRNKIQTQIDKIRSDIERYNKLLRLTRA